MNIYYITRTLAPYQNGGGPLMRRGAVEKLEALGWHIKVVMPGYRSLSIDNDGNIIKIPTLPILKITMVLQRLGLIEDYLDIWVLFAFNYLKRIIKKDDLLFATSGGELGTIKLAIKLKKKIGCSVITNFRDPIVYTESNGLKIDTKFHVNRENTVKKYVCQSDLIVTSSKSYLRILKNKYPVMKNKIFNNYFGYINKVDFSKCDREKDGVFRIAYMGTMTEAQKPELLYEALNLCTEINKKVEIVYIGNFSSYQAINRLKNLENVELLEYLSHDKMIEYMLKKVDVGFVSLIGEYYGACVPSKIYEYINLGIPILGALPEGDAKELINNNNFGIACNYRETEDLSTALYELADTELYDKIKAKIVRNREAWSMDNKIKELHEKLLAMI